MVMMTAEDAVKFRREMIARMETEPSDYKAGYLDALDDIETDTKDYS